ncbi:hypothetical protein [Ornithinimicrobium kibberense]|uniref:Uncharacterized protein n=1 Tax=Ornithinimicrobium kibberense TaxID=282060 RepID=A0ABV5V6K0_9MICO|nr:hypothetical protein [Ornithinimicrobium kibberense]
MSVATALGLTGWDCDLLATARSRWDTWAGLHPCLEVGVGPEGLRQWSLDAAPARANEVLLALAELGAPDGGGETAATGVLLWVLMPGAVRLSRSLARYGPDVDEAVAAQLWISGRTVAWRNRVKVAPSVMLSARRGVLLDLEVTARWVDHETPSEDMDLLPAPAPDGGSAGAVDLVHELLADARRRGVVSRQDCQVLLDLSEHTTTRTTTLCRAGLLSRAAAHQVAREHGSSRTTIFRRAHRALEALQATYADRARTA